MVEDLTTGTTLLACTFDGGVVIGADMKVSVGSYVASRSASKITMLVDGTFAALSGSLADLQAVSDIAAYYLDILKIETGTTPTVETAAKTVAKIVYKNKRSLLSSMIVGGFDARKGAGRLFAVPLGGALLEQDGCAISGSGAVYLQGYCDSGYARGMARAECEAFVVRGISHAIARDCHSGGGVRLVTVTKDGAEKRVVTHAELPFLMNSDAFGASGYAA